MSRANYRTILLVKYTRGHNVPLGAGSASAIGPTIPVTWIDSKAHFGHGDIRIEYASTMAYCESNAYRQETLTIHTYRNTVYASKKRIARD